MRGYPRNRLTERPPGEVVVSRTTLSRGYAISWDDAGAGPPIVLIPGATMSAADWRDAGYVDQLVPGHRVLSVDPLGLGCSDKPHDPEAYAWPGVADDVVAAMDAAGVDRAVIWGYSRGAGLAAAVAVNHPGRVSALILHDGGPLTVAPGSPPSALALTLASGDFSLMWDNPSFTFSDADRQYDLESNDVLALGAMYLGPCRLGASSDLRTVSAPALVLEGSRDDPALARLEAAALGVELQLLPGCNHLEAFSRLDLVMPAVRAFLEPLGL